MINRKLFFFIFSLIFFISCNENKPEPIGISQSQTNYIQIDSISAITQDYKIDSLIQPARDSVNAAMNEVIGISNQEIFKNQPNGSLNNLAADMVFEITKQTVSEGNFIPDFCLLNYGGLRYPIPKGEITLANIYQLMPFQNEAVILKLTGIQIDSLFNYIAFTNGQPISGCEIIIKNGKFIEAKIGGIPFDKSKTYNLVTSDYLADGGDKMSFLKNPLEAFKSGILIRTAMIDYVKQITSRGELIKANNEERIKIIN